MSIMGVWFGMAAAARPAAKSSSRGRKPAPAASRKPARSSAARQQEAGQEQCGSRAPVAAQQLLGPGAGGLVSFVRELHAKSPSGRNGVLD